MFSHSLKKILQQLSQQPGWEKYRQHCEVIECWQKITSPKVAENTRPAFISRQILWVTTSSSVWAQELSLQRLSLLKKLNSQLTFTLTDLRFSPAKWDQSSTNSGTEVKETVINPETFSTPAKKLESSPKIDDPKLALQKWLKKIQTKTESSSQAYCLCPQCEAPTPISELERWQICRHCAANKWSLEYRYPQKNSEK